MAEKLPANANTSNAQDQEFRIAAPQLNLPKGGGAIRGIGEKFAANPVTGTGSLTVPIYTSPGRSGFGPQLSLSYDSGSGDGPFGFGWNLSLPRITRKTDKGLPQYRDARESDTFILSGAEDLVPALDYNEGKWTRDVSQRTVYTQQYEIHRYRPRIEGLFARIERWVNSADPTDTFWRSISKDNITTWYGKTWNNRIYDPADASRVFTWLICESYDDKGNVISYQYKQEDSSGVAPSQANERNRTDAVRSAQRYIKYIFYGNRTPYFPDLNANPSVPLPTDWCFQAVFDYGEHDPKNPLPQDTGVPTWKIRADPFSNYRSTFEVRTYRFCQRVLMFHHFQYEPGIGLNCLVRSTDFGYAVPPPADSAQPFYSFLLSVSQTGYVRATESPYISSSLPPLQFEYTQAEIDEAVRDVDPESLKNLPYGIDGFQYRWADLDGEGLSGILSEQGRSWFYKPNLSPTNQQTIDGKQLTLPQFGPVQLVAQRPSLATLNAGSQQLMDLSGDGKLDLVDFQSPVPGFFERTDQGSWEPFQAFASLPVVDWRNPNLKFIDLTGDGFPDLLISDDDAFWWHTSLSTEGFGPGQRVPQALDEEKGPKLVFADSTESIFLADMSGDGLTDLVRVRNGEVCYWPNMGYGRFGPKITMDQSPLFDRSESFDGHRIHLADIDGSGTADIIYFASREVRLYFNQSGNAWRPVHPLDHFPSVDGVSSATPFDLLGNGTACLVWSSSSPASTRRCLRYIDLMGGQKPHLLVHVTNNLGAETIVQYAPSTKFYVADKIAGTPWLTRLPFPVHVVERVESYDYISRNRFVTRYAYHHGYYDGVEREFRGFGRVDQWDAEELTTLSNSSEFPQPGNEDPSSTVPPTWTQTWFHTGAYFGEAAVSSHMRYEYYSEGDSNEGIGGLSESQLSLMLLDDTVLPSTILLPDGTRLSYDPSGEELREACRALRGSILRQEIYTLDGSAESDRPYSVSERNYTIEVFQPQGPNLFGVFFSHVRETIDFHYERKLFQISGTSIVDPNNPPPGTSPAADPRVTHAITLSVDPYGDVQQSVAIGYGRRYSDPALTPADQSKQSTLLATYTDNFYTSPILFDDSHRTPLPAESSTYELIQFKPKASQQGITNLFRFEEVQTDLAQAGDGHHDIPYENLNPRNLNAGETYRRLLDRMRTYYRPDDMGQAAKDPTALLNFKILEPLALPGNSFKLVFSPGLITKVYVRNGTDLLPAPAKVLGQVSADGGGYIDLDKNSHWWASAGRIYYTDAPGASPQQEKADALKHFFLPRRFVDPFNNTTTVDYDDPHFLLVSKSTDALLGSRANVTMATNDYRVLQPSLLTDPNGSDAEVHFDALGLVAGSAVYKGAQGDSFKTFNPDPRQSDIDKFYAANDPHTLAGPLLGTATTRVVYDVQQFVNSREANPNDPTKWLPVFAATLARETHVSDLTGTTQTLIQITFSYSDGFGREIQKKIQAEPAADGSPRWVGSGWTIFNNKGKPVRQYEPFFSQLPKGHQFEFGVQVGVSSTLFYDPVDRVVATLHPNQTYEKVIFDPWHQDSWDVNDTVVQLNPAADPDVGDFFVALPLADYSPTWYQRYRNGTQPQRDAANKAAAHAKTPTTDYFDTLGRKFLKVLDNGSGAKFPSRVELDIQGNQRTVLDAMVHAGDQGRIVMKYDYDMLQKRIHQSSIEAGDRWMLNDCTGKSIRSWDSRGHNFRNTYDELRRPTGLFVQGTDNANSDPRTITPNGVQYEQIIYGEGQPSDQALNLRTRVYQHADQAGTVTNVGLNPVTNQNEAFDFKGNLLRSVRAFIADYTALPDWSAPPPMPESYTSSTLYDALNRATALTSPDASAILGLANPDASVILPTYNAANLIESVSVKLRGSAVTTRYVTNIDYNAKGQRVLVEYQNGASTSYTYDQATFRLTNLTTSRAGFTADAQTVQDLSYTYDPIGNITYIEDDADIHNVIYFRNQRVEPSADYTYDPTYRLIQASGREQLGLDANNKPLPPTATSYNDVPRVLLWPVPTDGNAVGTYTETYQYDPVGNFINFIHQGKNPASPGWTRTYAYNEPSPFEAGKVSNRLSSTQVLGNLPPNEPYTYDLHGNVTSMLQLATMQWDFKDQLYMTQRQAMNPSDGDGKQHQGEQTYYVYDASGQRVRKTTRSSARVKIRERLYLGIFELYREWNARGLSLAREKVRVMDDKGYVALVDTKTNDVSAPAGSLPVTTTRYQFDNHLGTACLELDETAAVVTYEEYYPYGSTSYQEGRTLAEVSQKRYRYTGKERDEESGLYYHGERYYACWLGRWMSCDPEGTTTSTQLYRYCSNAPVTRCDPRGAQDKSALDTVTGFVGDQWNTVIGGVRSAQEWVHEESLGVGKRIALQGVDDIKTLRKMGIHSEALEKTIQYASVLSGAVEATALEVIGGFLMFGPNMLEALDTAGKQIGEGAAKTSVGKTGTEKALGVAELSAGTAGAALVIAQALTMTRGFGLKNLQKFPPGTSIAERSAGGRQFENRLVSLEKGPFTDVQPRVTVRPNVAPGVLGGSETNVEVDVFKQSKLTGKFRLLDAKATAKAPLTKLERAQYPNIEKFGGEIVGRPGASVFPGGTVVPPTTVEIVRQNELYSKLALQLTSSVFGSEGQRYQNRSQHLLDNPQ
jgi:RHS repeat-associated protein